MYVLKMLNSVHQADRGLNADFKNICGPQAKIVENPCFRFTHLWAIDDPNPRVNI